MVATKTNTSVEYKVVYSNSEHSRLRMGWNQMVAHALRAVLNVDMSDPSQRRTIDGRVDPIRVNMAKASCKMI